MWVEVVGGRGEDESGDGLRPMEARGSDIYINEGFGGVRKQKGECAADKESSAERGGGNRMEHHLSTAQPCRDGPVSRGKELLDAIGHKYVEVIYRNCRFLA